MFEKIQLWVDIINAVIMIITVYVFLDMRFHPRFEKPLRLLFWAVFSALLALTYIRMEAEPVRTFFVDKYINNKRY